METSNLPLYPKVSSIYNKIIQLVIAIVLIIFLLNFWVTSNERSEKAIHDHFYFLAEEHLAQSVTGVASLELIDKPDLLDKYVNGVSSADWVYDAHVYDTTGRTLAMSNTHASIKDIYGISLNKSNKSGEYIPFIQEIKTEELIGFMRITVKKDYFTKKLDATNYDNHAMLRLMIVMSIFIGFLLTRGLNRFSRQGYRLPFEK